MRGRGTILLLGAFVVTRLMLGWLTASSERYHGFSDEVVVAEPDPFSVHAEALRGPSRAYADVAVEYPPGLLPAILLPATSPWSYRTSLVSLMVLVDAAGLAGLLRLRDRWGTAAPGLQGTWLWVIGVPLLGPVSLARLDLVPAVCTIWAVERAAAGRMSSGGLWLGLGAAVKLYPAGLVLPAALANRSPRLLVAAALAFACTLVPYVDVLPTVVQQVLGYHLERGLQLESTWASLLLVAQQVGLLEAPVTFAFGAYALIGPAANALDRSATVASLAVVAASCWLGVRIGAGRESAPGPAIVRVSFPTLLALLVTAGVLSPQYLLWALALGAAAVILDPAFAVPAALLLPAAVLTQAVYPFFYDPLTLGEPHAVALLAARNAVLVVAAGAAAAVALRGRPVTAEWASPPRPTVRPARSAEG